ncbi:lemA family protein [Firmicutes bacterium CAG:822]|nr:lemA family protein [Firmicutes bacterium CAG:822]
MWIYIVIAIVVIIVLYALITYNNFIKLKNTVKEAFATMDVYLKKRWDLIPNIVETVKGYAKHEENTLKEVVELRNSSYDSMSDDEKVKANQKISKDINKIMLLAESYPDLKASTNFQDLSRELSKVEEDIANSRKYYNGAIEMFNNKVEMFPSNIFAKLFGYKPKEMFETDEQERENIKVSF